MDEQNNGKGPMLWAIAVVIVALSAFGSYKYIKSTNETVVGTSNVNTVTNDTPNVSGNSNNLAVDVNVNVYKDGSYSAVGNYMSPGGSESVAVTVTLKDDVVTSAKVVANATRGESKQYQNKFISGYQSVVVGKKIEDINIIKVSGSSLTPKGFMDALVKIEAQAKA